MTKIKEKPEPKPNSFHARKAERTKHYEENVKGWRRGICTACNGSGKYDHNGSPDCGGCDGTGKEWYKLNCVTDIEPLFKKPLRLEISESVELRIYIRNSREVIYQFIGLDDDTRDPRFRTKLHAGYDTIDHVEDWCFDDAIGGRYYLHQFEPIETKTETNK